MGNFRKKKSQYSVWKHFIDHVLKLPNSPCTSFRGLTFHNLTNVSKAWNSEKQLQNQFQRVNAFPGGPTTEYNINWILNKRRCKCGHLCHSTANKRTSLTRGTCSKWTNLKTEKRQEKKKESNVKTKLILISYCSTKAFMSLTLFQITWMSLFKEKGFKYKLFKKWMKEAGRLTSNLWRQQQPCQHAESRERGRYFSMIEVNKWFWTVIWNCERKSACHAEPRLHTWRVFKHMSC